MKFWDFFEDLLAWTLSIFFIWAFWSILLNLIDPV